MIGEELLIRESSVTAIGRRLLCIVWGQGGRVHLARNVEGVDGPVAVEMATVITEITQKRANLEA